MVEETHSDVRTVTVQILIGIFGNGLSPFGTTFEFNVINVDTTVRMRFRYKLARGQPSSDPRVGEKKGESKLTCR